MNTQINDGYTPVVFNINGNVFDIDIGTEALMSTFNFPKAKRTTDSWWITPIHNPPAIYSIFDDEE